MIEISKIKEARKWIKEIQERADMSIEHREALQVYDDLAQEIIDIDKLGLLPSKDELARKMHRVYEEQAKIVGWKTQDSCQVPFDNLPETNKREGGKEMKSKVEEEIKRLKNGENNWWQKRWMNNATGEEIFDIRKKWLTAYQCAENWQKMYEELRAEKLRQSKVMGMGMEMKKKVKIKDILNRFEVELAFEEVSDQADKIVDNLAVELAKLYGGEG